jgi:hypothetical protein
VADVPTPCALATNILPAGLRHVTRQTAKFTAEEVYVTLAVIDRYLDSCN